MLPTKPPAPTNMISFSRIHSNYWRKNNENLQPKQKPFLRFLMVLMTKSLIFATQNESIMLQKGTKAPYFEGQDENGNAVKLTDFAGKKLVLYFYPKDSTPGCTAEACDLRDNYERFIALGYDVLGVSRDSAKSHQNFIAKHQLPFHLIADTDLAILKAYEAWGEKKMYGKVTEGTLRTTYVIDEGGTIIDAIGKVDTKNHTAQLL